MKVLKFFSSWCQPCKVLGNNLDATGIEYQSLDIDDNEDLVDKYDIVSVPTIVITDDQDNELGRITGIKSKEELLTIINKYKND